MKKMALMYAITSAAISLSGLFAANKKYKELRKSEAYWRVHSIELEHKYDTLAEDTLGLYAKLAKAEDKIFDLECDLDRRE